MGNFENSETLDAYAAEAWSRLRAAGYTYKFRWFYRPDGTRIIAYRDLPALVLALTQDLDDPRWAYARDHLHLAAPVSRLYKFQWALRRAANV